MSSLSLVGPCWTEADADKLGSPGTYAACSVSASSQAVSTLRRFARDMAEQWGVPDEAMYAMCLVVSELVTNSVLHSGSADVELAMRIREFTVTIQVKDSGTWLPQKRSASVQREEDEYGRGLQIVRTYTTRCLVAATQRGTEVNAEIDVSAPFHS
ncbi:ATP-binding protein [Streptomyces chartreusis]|uniref:ATP-binding protein n=1 Tax=Streptomyces chartreusis TaxID=1969 RepID=UPI0033D45677